MTAMQGQDLASVTWSIGLRNPTLSYAEVNQAFLDGTIVRTWPMRGTLHVVAPEDVQWILSLTSDRLIRGSLARRAALELSDRDLERARDAAYRALVGGAALTREAMYRVFDDAGVATTGQRGYHVLWFLAQSGTVVFGPPSGAAQTFALLEEWLPEQRALDTEESLGEFVYRYFRSHGPASIRDFAWWSSTTLTQARVGLAIALPRLDTFDRGGEPLYFAADLLPAYPRDGIRLLPGFDEYLLGYQNRSPQLPEDRAGDVVPGGNGVFRGTVVDDGTVIGTWKRAQSGKAAPAAIQTFAPANSRIDGGITRSRRDYAAFFDGTRANAR